MRYFAYCRKSQDDEGRQILSIPAQRDEVQRLLEKHDSLELVAIFEEARTAKMPGRPVFDEMVGRIQKGEAEGIIAWHPDRLARNSIDGGLLIYLLDQGVLKDLKFSTYTFENSSQGKFMLQIMFGYSKYYVDNLSENVKRGNRRKLESGILPNRPPIGYKNDPESRTIIPDPQTFPTIRRIWDLALARYSIARIRDMAEHEWGFRTPKRKRSGGNPLGIGTLYGILAHRFYTGAIPWRDRLYPGNHEAMVTVDEFERVQEIIGRTGREAPQKHKFAFTGLIRCGTCGCAVTAERQVNRYGYVYEYYHCTKKRRDIRCPERYVERRDLERQIIAHLRRYRMRDSVRDWALGQLDAQFADYAGQEAADLAALCDAQREIERNLAVLTDLRVRDLIDDTEFIARRDRLKQKAIGVQQQMTSRQAGTSHWLEPLQLAFSFSNLAVFWFQQGGTEEKRLILSLIGSNLTLTNKKLNIQAMELLNLTPRVLDIRQLCTVVNYVRTFSPQDVMIKQFVLRVKRLVYLQKKKKRKKRILAPANDNAKRKRAA